MDEYRKYLKFLASNNRQDIFTNENTSHAATVLTEMFINAGSKAVMLCHKLSEDIFTDEYKAAFKTFVGKSGSVNIMVKSDEYCNEGFFKELLEYENVLIKVVPNDAVKNISDTIGFEDCDFAVFDDKMFRLEYNAKQRKSLGSFNDPSIAKRLSEQFDKYFIEAVKCSKPS